MAGHPVRRRLLLCAAAVSATVLPGAAPLAGAQPPHTSAALSVTATVVQTCTVEQVRVPTLPGGPSPGERTVGPGPSYTIRCGKQMLTYAAPAGSRTGLLSKGAPVTVARTADGRAYLVQF
jgi:hypothetical protein